MVVVVLISVATAFVGLNFSGSIGGVRVRSTIREITASLRYARNQAVTMKKISRVTFDLQRMSYRVERLEAIDTTVEEDGYDGAWTTLGEKELPVEITGFEARSYGDWTGKDYRKDFIFYPGGDCSGGDIEFEDEYGRSHLISVNPYTGIIRFEG